MPRARRWGCAVSIVAALCALLIIAIWAVNSAKRAGHSFQCISNLHQIGVALRGYEMMHGTFPPAYSSDEEGTPTNSWRLRLGRMLYFRVPDAYDFGRPWDSPENASVFPNSISLSVFQCPSARDARSTLTDYVAVIGPNTMWPGATRGKRAADGSDDDKILVIEIINSNIHWMEPRDLTLDEALDAIQPTSGIGVGSRHDEGIHYVTVGGEVRTLDPHIDRESLRKLLVRDPANVQAETNPDPPDR